MKRQGLRENVDEELRDLDDVGPVQEGEVVSTSEVGLGTVDEAQVVGDGIGRRLLGLELKIVEGGDDGDKVVGVVGGGGGGGGLKYFGVQVQGKLGCDPGWRENLFSEGKREECGGNFSTSLSVVVVGMDKLAAVANLDVLGKGGRAENWGGHDESE